MIPQNVAVGQLPYPGLRSFLRSEFDIFFGRDDHVSDMVDKLAENHFLCVTGPSGCGKSSLARTGLFNALEAGFLPGKGSNWIFCDVHPETDPIHRLADGLSQAIVMGESGHDAPQPTDDLTIVEELQSLFLNHIERRSSNLTTALSDLQMVAGRPIVILVDQFEEIFRYAQDDPQAASRFVDVLLKTAAAKSDVYVVITIRTDELEKCVRYSGLTNAINCSQFLTPTLDRFEMKEAIEGPISLFDGRISPELSIWLLNGLEEQLDKLPLMQHALRLLYIEARKNTPDGEVNISLEDFYRTFAIKDHEASLSAKGHHALRMSLSHQLDLIYSRLSGHEQLLARGLFCALTTPDSPGRDIRRPIKLGEAMEVLDCDFDQLLRVVEVFKDGSESYLRIAGEHDGIDQGDTVDVTHECILRLWRPLQDEWLREEKQASDSIRHLARLAKERDQTAKGVLDRVRGTGLVIGNTRKRYSSWWSKWRPNAAWAARYLNDIEWSDGNTRLNTDHIFQGVRSFIQSSERYASYQTIALTGVVATGLLTAAYLVQAQAETRRAQAAAEIARTEAETQRLRAEKIKAEREADVAKREQRDSVEQTIAAIQPNPFVPDPFAVAEQASAALRAAIEIDLEPKHMRQGQEHVYKSLGYINEYHRFSEGAGARDEVYAAVFANRDDQLLTLTEGLDLSLWDRSNNRVPLRTLSLVSAQTDPDRALGRAMAISPDGTVAVGTQRGAILLVEDAADLTKRPQMLELYPGRDRGTFESAYSLDFSKDGQTLLVGALTGHVHIFRRSFSGKWRRMGLFTYRNLRDRVYGVPAQAANGQEETGADEHIWSVALSPSGNVGAIGVDDGSVCLFTLDGSATDCSRSGHDGPVKAVYFSPNSDVLVSAGNSDAVRIWSLSTQDHSARVPHGSTVDVSGPTLPRLTLTPVALWQDSDIWDLAFSPDGDVLAATSWDGTTSLYETKAWRPRQVLRGHTASPRTVEFSATGQELLTASLDKTARIWTPFSSRLTDYNLNAQLPENVTRTAVDSLALGPDASWLAYTNEQKIWVRAKKDVSKLLYDPGSGQPSPRMVVSPDAQDLIIAAMRQPEVRIWRKEEERWQDTIVPLTGALATSNRTKRKVAVSGDGSRYAIMIAREAEVAALVCRTDASTCGTDTGDHLAMIPFNAIISTKRPAQHDCVRRATITALALNTNGTQLAAGGSDCNIRLYDLTTDGQAVVVNEDHVGTITALDFAPDDSYVLSASADWFGRIWYPDRGVSTALKGHSSALSDAKVLPSGAYVATVSNDEKMTIWKAASGSAMLSIPGFTKTINALAVSSSETGVQLAAGTNGGDVLVQQFFETPEKLLDFAGATLKGIRGNAR